MQEVEDRILLFGVVLVTIRGIDGQATVHAEDVAVIPGMAHGAVLGSLAVVLGALAGDDEHREEAGTVTLDVHVLRIIHRNAVHDEVVGVDFRLRKRELHGPDVVLAALHVHGAAVRVGHPGAAELHDGGIVGLQAEGDAVILDLRGDHGTLAASEVEVGQFLRVHRAGDGQAEGEGGKDSFHVFVFYELIDIEKFIFILPGRHRYRFSGRPARLPSRTFPRRTGRPSSRSSSTTG